MKSNKSTFVANLITIVWCTKDGNTLAAMSFFVAKLLDFV
jgi:hypothetical protein